MRRSCLIRDSLLVLVTFVYWNRAAGDDPKIDTPKEFLNEALALVNELRDLHQVGHLNLNLTLCEESEKWAKKVGRQDEKVGFPHAYYSRKKEVTENVWASETIKDVNASIPIMDWYNQMKVHNWSDHIYSYDSAQFSAIVWKNSTQFGIAKHMTPNKKYVIVVARLSPPGNWDYYEDFKENVLPPKNATELGKPAEDEKGTESTIGTANTTEMSTASI